ncbi:MAG: penicillin-binding protein 1A [Gammaproteobacteria bacterium]|nr:penicillin-binding protein 1A [Gammaproteobacteria bacterium]
MAMKEFFDHILRRISRAAFYAFVLLSVAGFAGGVYVVSLIPQLPTIDDIRRVRLDIPLRIYSADKQLIAEYGNERRIPVPLERTPPLLIDAVLAIEDDRFYHHGGVDLRGILRAGISNLRSKSRAQGGSTITMQVARNFFLTPEKTYVRKLKEVLLAFNMERALTKDEILELYLNKIYLGNRAYGFAAASKVYYGVELAELSVPEIAMLAGLPKAPSRDNPITDPKRAVERRDYVLKRLHQLGKIDDFSYNNARRAPVTAARRGGQAKIQAPYAAEMARQILVGHFGEQVYESGYRVTVTIDSKYQEYADAALRKGLLDYDRRHGFRGPVGRIDIDETDPEVLSYELLGLPKSRALQPAVVLSATSEKLTVLTQDRREAVIEWPQIRWARPYRTPNSIGKAPEAAYEVASRGDIIYVMRRGNRWQLGQMPAVSGALVSLDPKSGAIRALSGGFDYYISKFNRATQARRQPGSNIKPFIYSAALDQGFTPSSLVSATPIVVEDPLEGVWRPQNYSRKFFGPTRLRHALSLSLNLVAVRLVRAIGIDETIAHLMKFGFEQEALPRSFSLALGSTDTTPLQLASGFAVFANGGRRIAPYLIERIVDSRGNEVEIPPGACEYCRPPEPQRGERVISEQNAFLISSMLQQVIKSGTGKRALALKRNDLSGKTGTTNNYLDAWFSGFNRDLITTVFIGFDDPSHLGRRESGAVAALPIWVDYMRDALKGAPERPLIPPPGIAARFINRESGRLTAPEDPDGYEEFYMEGSEPRANAEAAVDKEVDGLF